MGRTFRCGYENYKRCKKMILFILAIILLLSTISFFIMGMVPKTNSQNSSSITMEVSRKKVIQGENINTRLPMASTTKVMTAYLACISGKLDNIVTITKDMEGVEGSSIYLKAGEKYKLIDLVYGLMLQSGNDSAVAIAKYLGGSIEGFVKMMNDKAKKLNLYNTHFVNPNGLHDDNHYTTAYDLAYITCVALKNKIFSKICSTKVHSFISETGENKSYVNKNKLLKMYDGCIGVKTGYTKKAGRCLVSASERNGVKIVSVVLNKYDMWNDSMKNLDAGFEKCKCICLASKKQIIGKITDKTGNVINLGVAHDVNYVIFKDEETHNFTHTIILNKKLPENIKKGEIVGKIKFFDNNCLLFTKKIYNI